MKLPTLKGNPEMLKTDTIAPALATALASIDFSETNAEIERLDREQRTANDKAAEAESEAQRLAQELSDWTGPDSEALADAVLAGASPAEAALAAPTRETLADKRAALLAAAGALRDRAAKARRGRDEVAASQRLAIASAAGGFVEALAEEQQEAARAIVNADAALQALKWLTDTHIGPELASARARKGVTGMDSILGHVDRIAVPSDVVEALKPLETRAKGLRAAVPVTVANN